MTAANFTLLHGTIIFLVAQLYGIPFARAITANLSERKIDSWRMAHSSMCVGGVSIIAIALVLRVFEIPHSLHWPIAGTLVFAGYGFLIVTGLGAKTGQRGLAPSGPSLNKVLFVASVSASLASVAATTLLLIALFG